MSQLQVSINRVTRVARFSGRGTFEFKEQIKLLGRARFNGSDKSWEVSEFEFSIEDLQERFPGIEVEEAAGQAQQSTTVVESVFEQVITKSTPTKPEALPANVPPAVSVTEFTNRARMVLKGAFPGTFCIYGILSDVGSPKSGRLFMEMRGAEDADARIKCVIWDNLEEKCAKLQAAGFKLEAELQVMFEVSVNLNKRGGQISLTVERIIVEYTLGKLAALREVTNERLKKEGLFDRNKALALPFLPRRLGILTSAGGTVINDFLASLDRAEFGFEIYWYNITVQGNDARKSILRGLTMLGSMSLDAVLIFRGGGSQGELAVFNDYDIAKAVCLLPVPVVSAIGHQEDQCSVQDVSFKALGVPKDIGHFFAEIILNFRERLDRALTFIRTVAATQLAHAEQSLSVRAQSLFNTITTFMSHRETNVLSIAQTLPMLTASLLRQFEQRFTENRNMIAARGAHAAALFESKVAATANRVRDLSSAVHARAQARFEGLSGIGREIVRIVDQKDAKLDALSELIRDAAPETQLRRGFALVKSPGGKTFINSGAALKADERIEIQFHDSTRKAKIEGE